MPFLILTRAGFDDIVARVAAAGAVFHLNPGVASGAEIARLRAAGTTVHVLAQLAQPEHAAAVEQALRAANTNGDTFWVERGPVEQAALVRQRGNPALGSRLANSAGSLASAALRRLRKPGAGRGLMLLPYHGFGNTGQLWVKGRVLDERIFREPALDDSRWRNLLALYRRLESDQVQGARVCASFQGRSYETHTDKGGYFAFDIAAARALRGGWEQVELALPDHRNNKGEPVRASAPVLVPPASARFGVISDIDDTVLWTNVTNKLNMALMLARSNAHTRKPFKGVAAFYRALQHGPGGNEENPVFYVSSSPWHLFEPLVQFLRVQSIPLGPLLLRELGMREVFKLTSHGNHKLGKIDLIMRYHPEMQFVLIGDSGEQDPEIYAEVVRRHPKAVRVIYIRNVNPDPSRIEALDRLSEQVAATGVELVVVPDSVAAATHAAAEGLIHVDRLASVRADEKDDSGAPA